MKKLLALLLALFLFIAVFTGCDEDTPENKDPNNEGNQPPVQDNANPATDFEYEENEDGGITISKYIGTDTDVIIPAQIDDKNVTIIGEQAFVENDVIVTVNISDTVIGIKDGAFATCTKLTTVVLSQNTEYIGTGAFMNCIKLASIELPSTLHEIESMAFWNCQSLERITLPQKLYSIGENVFSESGLEFIEFEENGILERISNGAFAYTRIEEIVIPKQIKYIRDSAFAGCESLKAVKFEGNAPEDFLHTPQRAEFTVYYHEGAQGFTSPEWCGYPAKIW